MKSLIKQRVRLCAFYMSFGARNNIKLLQNSLKSCDLSTLLIVKQELEEQELEFFWEVADREKNMDFMPPTLHKKVGRVFGFLKADAPA